MALDFFTKRKIRKEAKQLEESITRDDRPDLRLRLAGLYRKLEQHDNAIAQYRVVTQTYLDQGKRGQAEAVCKSVLEFYPQLVEFQQWYASITGRPFGMPESAPEPAPPPSEEDEVGNMMSNQWSEPEEPTPIADYNKVKNDTWQDESDPAGRRIPSPPAGIPRISATLTETITNRFSTREDRLSSIANSVRSARNETIDIFADQEQDIFSAAWHDNSEEEKTPQAETEGSDEEENFWETAPLLRDLDEESRQAFRKEMVPVAYDPGTVILREGDPGTSLFLIVDGEIRVTKLQPSGEEKEIATLNAGEFFGEFALLADQKRHATITAVTRCTILEIPKKTIREIGKKHPSTLDVIKKFYRQRMQDLMLKNLPFFQLISEEKRSQYLGELHFLRFGSGTPIIKQGEKGGGLFLILLGEVEVITETEGGEEKLLAVLGEGEYFGEMALLKRKPAMATVRSRNLVEIVQVPPKTFFQILADHPPIWRKMQEEVEKRQLLNHFVISGRSQNHISY